MLQSPKKFIPLIIAVALALLATYLVNMYLQQKTEEAKKLAAKRQQNITTVVIAKQDIGAGTTINEGMVEEVNAYKDSLQPRAATTIDRVVNKIAVAPIAKGEQVLLNKVTLQGQETTLAAKIPRGKRAITIPVDNISSVGGMVRPGDHVDVMGVVPIPMMTADGKQTAQMTPMALFQDVLVLAVGQEYTTMPSAEKKAGERALYPVITLALAPQEANLIAFVQEQGSRIRLVLRSPEDTQVQQAAPTTWDTLFRTVMPGMLQQQEAPKPKNRVEIFHGLQKEVKDLQ